MHEIATRHTYVGINNSFVHLVQYGKGERIIKSVSDSPATTTKSNGLNYSPNTSERTYENDSKQQQQIPTIDDNNGNSAMGKKLVIFIPGNPGLLGVYHDYLELLYKTICRRAPNGSDDDPILLAISHNNFDHPSDQSDYIKTDERIIIAESDLNFIEQSIARSYAPNDIELQVLNKLIILKHVLKYNLEDCQLVFVGHSIGCYIILRLLQDGLLASVHHGSIMIHPALENLALTSKGTYFDRLFNLKFDYLLRSLAYVAERLVPKQARLSLTRRFVCSPEMAKVASEIVIESLAQLCCSGALRAMIEMAKSEFATIKNIDHNLLIKPHVERLRLVYAKQDHWVNSENRRELAKVYSNLHIEEQDSLHAFIMEPETVIDYAIKVGIFIQTMLE